MLNIIKNLKTPKAIIECEECGGHFETNKYDAAKSSLGGICKPCKTPPIEGITQDYLKKLFLYDETTGEFIARVSRRGRPKGTLLGSTGATHGYLEISIDGTNLLLHRVIWLYQTGKLPEQVDHIDHNKHNNKWDNLREVCNTTNLKNCSISKNSVTRVNGVSYCKRLRKYRAYIMVNRKQINLGWFKDINDAIAARKQADIDYGFHSNHGK